MTEYKYVWHCPHCGKVILKSKWILDGFILKCPNCKKMVDGVGILQKNERVIDKFLEDTGIKVIHS